MSGAETVKAPAALIVICRSAVPPDIDTGPGSVALASDDVIVTALVIAVTTFQDSSHALTVTVNGTPTVCACGVPSLPDPVPGAAVSPGSSTCNCV